MSKSHRYSLLRDLAEVEVKAHDLNEELVFGSLDELRTFGFCDGKSASLGFCFFTTDSSHLCLSI